MLFVCVCERERVRLFGTFFIRFFFSFVVRMNFFTRFARFKWKLSTHDKIWIFRSYFWSPPSNWCCERDKGQSSHKKKKNGDQLSAQKGFHWLLVFFPAETDLQQFEIQLNWDVPWSMIILYVSHFPRYSTNNGQFTKKKKWFEWGKWIIVLPKLDCIRFAALWFVCKRN